MPAFDTLLGPVIAGEGVECCNWVVPYRTPEALFLETDGCENYSAQGVTSGCLAQCLDHPLGVQKVGKRFFVGSHQFVGIFIATIVELISYHLVAIDETEIFKVQPFIHRLSIKA